MHQGITRSPPGNASGHHPVPAGECLKASPVLKGLTTEEPGTAKYTLPIFKKLLYLPSLATSCENMVSISERIMEKSRNFQIFYVGCTNLCKYCTTTHARGILNLGISQRPHSPIAELSLPLGVVTVSFTWRVQPLLGSSEFT